MINSKGNTMKILICKGSDNECVDQMKSKDRSR